MDLSCSNEKFNLMNSLLDKELETLKNFGGTKSSKLDLTQLKSPSENQKEKSSQIFSTPQAYETKEKSPRIIADSNSYEPNSKLQEELTDLQNKLSFLEQKLTDFQGNSMANTGNLQESKYSQLNSNPDNIRKNQFFLNKKENEIDSDHNTPLKQKYERNPMDYELKGAIFSNHNQRRENKENLNYKSNIQEETRNEKQKNKKKIKNIERSIEKNENILNLSRNHLKSSSSKKKLKNKSTTPNSRNYSPNPFIQNTNLPEIIQLNKKIMFLKKNLDEERAALQKEKQKNKEMKEEIEKMNKKIKKLEVKQEKNSHLESDYMKLMESFEKSEAIRKQQKKLIAALKKEQEITKISKKKC